MSDISSVISLLVLMIHALILAWRMDVCFCYVRLRLRGSHPLFPASLLAEYMMHVRHFPLYIRVMIRLRPLNICTFWPCVSCGVSHISMSGYIFLTDLMHFPHVRLLSRFRFRVRI